MQSMSVAVIGAAGTIGARVAEALAPKVREIVIYDRNEPRDLRLQAYARFNVAGSTREAIAGRDLVVGCTGECTLRGSDIGGLKEGAILASTGSERTEFPVATLEYLSEKAEPFRPGPINSIASPSHGTIYTLRPRGKSVILLNNGEPVNFSHMAPPESAVFDLVMATIFLGSIELALGQYDGRTGFLDVFDLMSSTRSLTVTNSTSSSSRYTPMRRFKMTNALRRLSEGVPLCDPRYGTVFELAGPATGLATMGVAWAEVDVGATSPAAWHHRTEESYFIIEGRGVMRLGDEIFSVAAGDVVSIRPGVIHNIENSGAAPLRMVVVTAPPYDEADDIEVGA
jgi:mannose-6-phosphate isomerase-like protein (cupin superfamily)